MLMRTDPFRELDRLAQQVLGTAARPAAMPMDAWRPAGKEIIIMAVCDTCGNDYDKAFTITRGEVSGTFDSFECAIQAMAPACAHCGCRIIGHGTESAEGMYCCANCARHAGQAEAVDRT